MANYSTACWHLVPFPSQVCYKRDWHDLIAKGTNVLGDAIPITAAKASRNIASDVSKNSGWNLGGLHFLKIIKWVLVKVIPHWKQYVELMTLKFSTNTALKTCHFFNNLWFFSVDPTWYSCHKSESSFLLWFIAQITFLDTFPSQLSFVFKENTLTRH